MVVKVVLASLIGLSSSLPNIDCQTAACPDQCSCAMDRCANDIDACLDDENCARAQACALACPCGDNQCILQCAQNSDIAVPAAECIESQCMSSNADEGSSALVYYYRRNNADSIIDVAGCEALHWDGAKNRSFPGVNAETKPQIKKWICGNGNELPEWFTVFDAIYVITKGRAKIGIGGGSQKKMIQLETKDSLFMRGGMIGGPIKKVGDEDLEFTVVYASANDDFAQSYRTFRRGKDKDAPLTKSPFTHNEATCDTKDPGPTGKDQSSGVWNYTFPSQDGSPAVLGVIFNPTCEVARHYHPTGAIYLNTKGVFTIHNDGGPGGDSNPINPGEVRWVGPHWDYGPEISTDSKDAVDIIVVGNDVAPIFDTSQDSEHCDVLGESASCLVPSALQYA